MRFGVMFSTVFVVAALALLFAPAEHAASSDLISPEKAKQLIENGGIDLILDVRTLQEHTGPLGNIEGSKLIPVQVLADRLDEINEYKDKTILVYCHVGVRSSRSAKILASGGFKKVLDLDGGIISWIEKGNNTVRTGTAAR